jgi:hypothetical protein
MAKKPKGNLYDYLKEDEEMRQRYIEYAYKNNKSSDFGDFVDALNDAFSTDKGNNARAEFDEDIYKLLYESGEFERVYGVKVKRKEVEEIEIVKAKQEPLIVQENKPIKVNSYERNGTTIKSYAKSYRAWSNAELRFLKVRKAKNVETNKIISEFNKNFNPRSKSSLKTKFYRI